MVEPQTNDNTASLTVDTFSQFSNSKCYKQPSTYMLIIVELLS